MTLLPVQCQPPFCNRLIFRFPCGPAHCVPRVADTGWYCEALHSLSMLFASLKALWRLELVAHVFREQHLLHLSAEKWYVSFRHACHSRCSWHRQQVLWWLRCSRMGFIGVCMTTTAFLVICLASMSLLVPYTLAALNRKAGQIHSSVPQNQGRKPWNLTMLRSQTWKWCRGWIISTENNWWNNEFKLSKMENWFRGGDYHSQWRLKLSKWLGVHTLLMLTQMCAIQGVMLLV